MTWAVNPEKDSYIFRVPSMPEEAGEDRYYFRFKDRFYGLRSKGLFDDTVTLDDPVARQDLVEPLIALALHTLGRFGYGCDDSIARINPNVVVPSDQENGV